ncbi:ABC transporter ATP-binding protein [Frankia sp. CNm7]|uniref:ABC transporter ATP-binding protein n=2 Tax=Frankia nepalensis TaxID=1836974 RepID=A0A937RJ57_9ACTN|nr:ABC transporter ATP-binding protein [Frankia nepalensis]MBL7498687.1 ABC transporter ATP-binding protein [Frankia nepalensis]MBL7509148.1 ABC transporter ATP-binding protein [Frankia nepalensis]MBL7518784.1 ABC transporter ATP-binding protein [Frankia nepalensis]MBL7633228.1 ABC transporter ATP-binding protein [Frankia nepalensis]
MAQAPARPGALLRVEHLVQRYRARGAVVHAVSDVSFDLLPGECLGLVGESGCGKSTTGRAILQLPRPTAGRVVLDGEDLCALDRRRLRHRRHRLQMIFQDPVAALNPRRRVRDLVVEGLDIQRQLPGGERAARADALLRDVGLDPELVGDRRPHELSGGQCQRVAIARALAVGPDVLVCDEPVASLDVSVQAQVLTLLARLRAEHRLALLFVAHDLAVVRAVVDRVAVMYLGTIAEIGPVDAVYDTPAHPYTRALLDAVPVPDPAVDPEQAPSLTGELPSPLAPPSGCPFRTRCPRAADRCAAERPLPRAVGPDHHVACHFPLVDPLPDSTSGDGSHEDGFGRPAGAGERAGRDRA